MIEPKLGDWSDPMNRIRGGIPSEVDPTSYPPEGMVGNVRVETAPNNEPDNLPGGKDHYSAPDSLLQRIRVRLIQLRDSELTEGRFDSSVELSHLIAAISQGCFEQVKAYEPSQN